MTNEQKSLNSECYKAHTALALRQCTSTAVFMEAFRTNGNDFRQAVIAALATLGGIHAPIRKTYRFLANYDKTQALPEVVPGWGSDFIEKERDRQLDDWAKSIWLANHNFFDNIIVNITDRLHAAEKLIYPNAACYTAATALILNFPEETAEFLMINPRLSAWSGLANNTLELNNDKNIPTKKTVQRLDKMGEDGWLEN